ncbi:MAG: DHA2 family efflux MFS transporter permease subunit [Candidatus Omnitrophica bacterium]|nr:DHA2 family efflux MFS transporter permease subunit [Candidatus Omnitrophota bacterium]
MEDHIITEKSGQNWLIAIISLTVFMFCIDYSMLNISLPVIAKYFNATIGHVSRLPLAYLLVVTSTVLLFGKLGDIAGFKKIFVTGLVIFVTGTLLCGIAPTLNILLGLRVYQCIGEAMFSPIGIAIVTVFLPSTIKGRALGIMATAQGLGFCLGPVLGGYINDHLGWHSIFFVNIPLGIFAIVAAIKLIPSKQPVPEDRRVDFFGASLIFICLSTLIYALNSISGMGLKNPVIISSFVISAVTFILFIMQEKRASNPILDLSLFSNRDFAFATVSAFCVIFVYMGLIFLLPFYLNMVRGLDIMHSGLMLMIPALMVIISAPIAGLISDRLGSRSICTFGISMTTLAFFMFSLLKPDTPLSHLMPSLIIAGIAIGCFLPANNKLVMALAPSDKQGMASAVYKILNSTGGVFGIAILPLIIMTTIRAQIALARINMSAVKEHPEILIMGFDAAFKFGMIVCLAGLVFTVLAKDKKAQ